MTTYDLDIIAGSSANFLVSATDQNSTIINLNGYNVRGAAKAKFSDSSYVINFNPTIYSAVSGIVQIFLSGSQTSGLPISQIPYELEVASSGEVTVTKFLKGYLNIFPEITNI
jgi:hypothetical protein